LEDRLAICNLQFAIGREGQAVPEPENLTPKQLDAFGQFIYRASGIRIDASKVTLVSNRVRRRVRAGQFADFDAYYRFLTSGAGANELEQFLDAITTNPTHFFRTPRHFDWFRGEFVTEMIARQSHRPQRRLRVWSAASSSGEEAYSLAICLAENALRLRDWQITVLGTDISEAVLCRARAASYQAGALAEVSDSQRRRYFEASADGHTWRVRPAVSEMVEFRRHNLMEPLRELPFDCIFVRNVLIYFDRDSKKVVIKNLLKSLASGGYLVVGPSEGIYDMLEPLVKRTTFLYQKV
jgi:chemotaxis protein methyltransferase CheR